ncbi:MAG TPA: DNA cytosine methyltransferase [Achromobacter sp.]|nr:DNA cytosine methyltransferase [Achromobacter sp.]
MAGTAYYNEIDPYAADWLRNLIAAGHIAPGDVDERSIEDVHPDDLRPYTQCHFFAGIGVWSYALRRAGWPDDRPVWTGSCPCQPFSAAGKGTAFDDERHLWPAWHWLIQERRPSAIFGEQVASKDAEPWLDLVSDDLESLGFAFGAVAFPSSSIGAPHIRDRTYFMADAANERLDGWRAGEARNGRRAPRVESERLRHVGRLAYAESPRPSHGGQRPILTIASESGRNVADLDAAGPVNGFWRAADWLLCRDGKWRPVEPGTFPLAHGATARVGRLRAYGNAINAQQAQIFIEESMRCI